MSVFGGLRSAIDELVGGSTAPADRSARVRQMKEALVHARLAVEDMRTGVARTRARLAAERTELATVQRRRELALGINDAETVRVAARFEAQHGDRVRVLTDKLAAQEAEAALAEQELAEMTAQLKAAAKGVGNGPAARGPTDAELGLPDDTELRGELDGLRRAADRAAKEDAAAARLADLKKKMGRSREA